MGALFAPNVMAIRLRLSSSLLRILQNLATIVIASGCFLRSSLESSTRTEAPSASNASISSPVTGSSNRSSCIDGTNNNGVPLPLAAERAIMTGESMMPCMCLAIVFRVAGASRTPSKPSSCAISGSQSVSTSVPEPHERARGVITLSALLVIIVTIEAPCRRSSLASLTDSTAAIPPETANKTVLPARQRLLTSTPVSPLTCMVTLGAS